MVEVLKDKELKTRNERAVFDFVLEYTDHNAGRGTASGGGGKDKGKEKETSKTGSYRSDRRALLTKLLPCVKFSKLPISFLIELDTTQDEYSDIPIFSQLLHYAFKWRAMPEFISNERQKLTIQAAYVNLAFAFLCCWISSNII